MEEAHAIQDALDTHKAALPSGVYLELSNLTRDLAQLKRITAIVQDVATIVEHGVDGDVGRAQLVTRVVNVVCSPAASKDSHVSASRLLLTHGKYMPWWLHRKEGGVHIIPDDEVTQTKLILTRVESVVTKRKRAPPPEVALVDPEVRPM